MKRNTKVAGGVIAAGVLAVALSPVGAQAAKLVTSSQIKDGTIKVVDLSPGVQSKLGQSGEDGKDGAQGPAGPQGPAGSTTPGPAGPAGPAGSNGQNGSDGHDGADGVAHLIAGSSYTTTWQGDNGASLQTVREECPAGQYALGGGFSTWGGDKDLGGDNKNIQVTVSAPFFEGEYVPVDDGGNFRPTEWVVKGFNNGDTDQIVRAWVTCADVN